MPQQPSTDRVPGGGPAKAGPSTERSIFREEARQHHRQNQERVVLPRLVSPGVFVYLWILALGLMVAGLLFAFAPLIGGLG